MGFLIPTAATLLPLSGEQQMGPPNPRVMRSRTTIYLVIGFVLVVIGFVARITLTGAYASWRAARMPDDALEASAAKPDASYPYVVAWAHRLEARSKFEDGERAYERAMVLRPTAVDAWCGYGRSAFGAGDWGKAEAELRKTVDQWGDNPDARFAYAALLTSTFRLHPAIDQTQAGLRRDPQNGQAWLTLGELDMRVGDAPAAVDAYSKANKLIPNAPKVHSYYGSALLSAGKFEQAKVELETALKVDPSDINARFDMGKALAYGGKKEDRPRAMQELNRVVKFSVNKSRAYMEAGRIWLRDNERGNAIQDLEQAYQLNKTNTDMLNLLMQAYSDDGQRVEAAKVGVVLARAQKLADERTAILAGLDSGKDVVSSLIKLGRVDRDLDNPIEARSAFEAAAHLDPDNADAASELNAIPPKVKL
jgi:cytochrome c-type biogenesis protein CcmH/NrfG